MKSTNYNLGCGTEIKEGWINIDNADLPEVKGQYEKGDITTYKYEPADLFLIDNVLEHFNFEDGSKLLKYLRPFLKEDGRVVVIVPDFEHLSKVINLLSPNSLFSNNSWCKSCLLGTQVNDEDIHRAFYTQAILKYVAEVSGYVIEQILMIPYEKHGGYHLRAVLRGVPDVQRK